MADEDKSNLPFDAMFSFITGLPELQAVSDKAQFFQDLIYEGLFSQNLHWDRKEGSVEVLYFAYERFGDHMVTAYLLEKYLDKADPEASFKEEGRLYAYVKNEQAGYYNKGIIEALSIQLPEQINLELFEVAPEARAFEPVAAALLESIIWRKKDTFNEKLLDYIDEVVIGKYGYGDLFINTILLVTSVPDHFFNSHFLHRWLLRFSMADRDAWWIPLIHPHYPGTSVEVSSIRKMIDWAWTPDLRKNISDESIGLMCQTMGWFLVSTNRTLRDSATKAIICLLEERIPVLIQFLAAFSTINDPYISQRVYAIAYGCAVRTL
jgi:hypothetical protein